ncbi:MAG TPA: TetR/AcrR family transcriptional regulator [Bradyrhizobium sp.]|nr:TetR/AcrR family transcriptional regulator [Bradyrhizobium sp.]
MVRRNLRNKDASAVRSKIAKPAPKKATRDPERTKQRILTVASDEFANKGYDGARVDEIVRRSKVSKNLIYYYFGSKEELFIAVLESAYVNLREQQDALGLNAIPPEDAIRKLVADLFHYWRNSRAFIGFLTSENFHKAKHIKKSKFAPNAYQKLIESLSGVLEAGVKQGVFRDGVDPINLYISISGLSYQYFSNQYTLSFVLNKDLTSKEALDARLKHTEDVILGYLRPTGH